MTAHTDPEPAHPATAALQSAVDGVYLAVRRRARRPPTLDICDYCCVSEETALRLRDLPPARLDASDFREYNTSAKSEIQDAAEVGYFLPHMLALLARGHELHHSLEIALDRLGRCPVGSWSADERAAFDRFALAYFDAVLQGPLANRWCQDPLSVLLMFHIGGLSITPLLERWEACEHPCSTTLYVRATYRDFWSERRYENAFADDRPEFLQQARDWLLRPSCRQRFAARLVAPAFLARAESEPPTGCMSFEMMTEAVFDHLTR